MKLLPLFYNLNGKRILIVGGGKVALQKANLLVEYGTIIDVVSPTILPELSEIVSSTGGQWMAFEYAGELSHLDHQYAIAATNNRSVNVLVATTAKAQEIPVNVCDDDAACDFLFGSTIDQALVSTQKIADKGEVYLIGAGPGDPDLLTIKAFRLLQQADLVVYDRLVSKEVMALIKPGTQLMYVGKERSDHSVPQGEINQLLADHAKQGKRVARLKGGDPFIFGRGGEEIDTLVDQNIPFQVVPGITAANGCSAYAGIPLTSRGIAQTVQFVTGQLKDGVIDLDWKTLVAPDKTLVFYMGLNTLSVICQSLIDNGMDESMPIALVEKGTTASQRLFTSTLADIPDKVADEQIESPSLIIVGHVVGLSDKLQWFGA
jgi:uroporphyrin-III C-methyltransferase